MPHYPVDRATNFIVEQESWTVVEYDHTSVPGVIYLSLTEGKINSIYDDVENNIADLDKLARYELLMPPITQVFHLGDHIEPIFTLTKNGTPYDGELVLSTSNKQIVRLIDNELIAVGRGEVDIIATLKDFPDVKQSITITVGEDEAPKDFSAYIEGVDTIRLDRESTYSLIGNNKLISTVQYQVDDTTLCNIVKVEDNQCTLRANNKNKLGEITLTAIYNSQSYEKKIKIIPLW